MELVPVVLAGGSGTRLWPLSRSTRPKHLLALFGRETLFEATLARTAPLASGPILVVGVEAQAELLAEGARRSQAHARVAFLLEPEGRNTAAAVALAAHWVRARVSPRAIMYVCPADHRITRPEALAQAIARLCPPIRDGHLGTFGITPSRPETGFGYIRLGPELGQGRGVYRAARFVEKPPPEVAIAMLEQGGHLWNSGMFLFRADVLLEELARHAPEIAAAVELAWDSAAGEGRTTVAAARYRRIPSLPVDKAVMERSERVVVAPVDPGWSDVGSWQAVWELSPRDEADNAVFGDVVLEAAGGNLVRAESRLVTLAGVEGLAVVDTEDALLVARREDSESLRRLVARLQAAGRQETVASAGASGRKRQAFAVYARDGLRIEELELAPDSAATLPDDALWLAVVAGEGRIGGEGSGAPLAPGACVGAVAGARVTGTGRRPLVLLVARRAARGQPKSSPNAKPAASEPETANRR